MFGMCKKNPKTNAAAKTASNNSSLLAQQRLPDLVGQRSSSLIINFEWFKKSFLARNFYFTLSLPVVDFTFLQEYLYVIIMSHTSFRMNLHSIVAWILRKFKWRVTSWKYSRSNIGQPILFVMTQTFRLLL